MSYVSEKKMLQNDLQSCGKCEVIKNATYLKKQKTNTKKCAFEKFLVLTLSVTEKRLLKCWDTGVPS